SRRRHTRCYRDWSSDVCSSDLEEQQRKENIFDRFPSYSIQRFSVLLSKDQTRAVMEKVLTIGRPDEALLSFSERLREPVVLSTEIGRASCRERVEDEGRGEVVS